MANVTGYKFTVNFDSLETDEILKKFPIRYAGDKKDDELKRDSVLILKNRIEIEGKRTNDRPLDTVDKIYSSQFYFHLLRALVYYYAHEMSDTRVLSIEFEKSKKGKPFELEQKWNTDSIRKLFFHPSYCKNKINIKKYYDTFKVFDCKRKPDFYSDIIMYFLQGCSESDSKKAFEYYWRSLNCLYEHHISGKEEKTKLRELKNYSEEKDFENTFVESKKFILDNLEKIKNELDWNRYFKYRIEFENSTYKDLVFSDKIEFHNPDFLSFFKDRFTSGNIECTNKDKLLKRIDDEIEKPSEKRSEIDFITFIVTRYMYYLRCSNFHAATNYERNSLFNVNYFDNEFKLINEIISLFLVELINSLNESFFYKIEKTKKERIMEDMRCPKCGKIMSKDTSIKEGTKSSSFDKCIRKCNDCEIGYSNAKDKPTLIFKNYLQSIPSQYVPNLELTIENPINTGHIESKKKQFGFSTSEDALTWIFIRYFINENKLEVLKNIYTLGSDIEEILLWGVPQINTNDSSQKVKLTGICKSLKEAKKSYSEPDIVIITKTEIRFIEVKLASPNAKCEKREKFEKYINNNYYVDKEMLINSKHYELTRNWTIGNMFAETKGFKLINQGPSKLFYNEDKELLQKFENSLLNLNNFEKLSWEKVIDNINESVDSDFIAELKRRLGGVL